MQKTFLELFIEIEKLHTLPMTTLETLLKRCLDYQPALKERVLSPEEMWEYARWMVENFGSRSDFSISDEDIPFMLAESNAADVAKKIRTAAADAETLLEFRKLYTSSGEHNFFSENHSITASRLFRHMPAYWNHGDYFELYYVFSGECPFWFKEEAFLLKTGTVLLVPPAICKACRCPNDNSIMMLYKIRSSTFSRVFWRNLSAQNVMSLFFREALGDEIHTNYLCFDIGQNPDLEWLLCAIYNEYITDTAYSTEITNSLMSTFFLMLLQKYEHTARLSKINTLHWKPEYMSIFHYIQEKYNCVTIEDLAQKFNYSTRQIIRIIKSCTGKTFSNLLIQLRMEKAAHLLKSSNLSIEEISEQTGYSTISSFYRTFSGYYKCTPKEYQKKKS